ncbi:hypothetical protein COO60DRAFT_258060 [Scenedesmus sp. NREL 46B-D3]|nr:hypothetical protein COO60DRAFT_258060 [Scenedesmus sp. NREL 46B-D3]
MMTSFEVAVAGWGVSGGASSHDGCLANSAMHRLHACVMHSAASLGGRMGGIVRVCCFCVATHVSCLLPLVAASSTTSRHGGAAACFVCACPAWLCVLVVTVLVMAAAPASACGVSMQSLAADDSGRTEEACSTSWWCVPASLAFMHGGNIGMHDIDVVGWNQQCCTYDSACSLGAGICYAQHGGNGVLGLQLQHVLHACTLGPAGAAPGQWATLDR